MDKLVIIGGYEFLGFYLTTLFLEKGLHVNCVNLEKGEDAIYEYEEKRFTVGRNANFYEITLDDWINFSPKEVENTLIVISLYDLFLHKEKGLQKKLLQDLLNKNLSKSEVLFLFPIQYLGSQVEIGDIADLVLTLKMRSLSVKQVYLPTLYGPWQPNEYLFQQTFLNELAKKKDLQIYNIEYVNDAIYICDAIKEIDRIIENAGIQMCLLQSERADHWLKCAEFLKINPSVYAAILNQYRLSCSIPVIKVKESIGFEKGLEVQKGFVKRLLNGFL